jgi:hypothetical protein
MDDRPSHLTIGCWDESVERRYRRPGGAVGPDEARALVSNRVDRMNLVTPTGAAATQTVLSRVLEATGEVRDRRPSVQLTCGLMAPRAYDVTGRHPGHFHPGQGGPPGP